MNEFWLLVETLGLAVAELWVKSDKIVPCRGGHIRTARELGFSADPLDPARGVYVKAMEAGWSRVAMTDLGSELHCYIDPDTESSARTVKRYLEDRGWKYVQSRDINSMFRSSTASVMVFEKPLYNDE